MVLLPFKNRKQDFNTYLVEAKQLFLLPSPDDNSGYISNGLKQIMNS